MSVLTKNRLSNKIIFIARFSDRPIFISLPIVFRFARLPRSLKLFEVAKLVENSLYQLIIHGMGLLMREKLKILELHKIKR